MAAIKMDYPKEKMRIIYNWWTIILVFIIMIVAVTIGVNHNMAVGNYMLYSWICLPCFMIILLGLSGVDSRATSRSKVLRWLSGIMYVFFLAQLFSNRISKRIIEAGNITSNMLKIIIGWAACIIIALTLRIIEINLNSFLNNLFLKNDVNSQT